jgi:hypothetical protein
MSGLLGTAATVQGDLNFLLQIMILVILFVGYRYGRVKESESLNLHGKVMTVVVVLNAVAILLVMGPSFVAAFGAVLDEVFKIGFPLTSLHHSLGLAAEVLGIVFVFRKFGNVRRWMRVTIVVWLSALGLGMSVYVLYFVLRFPF